LVAGLGAAQICVLFMAFYSNSHAVETMTQNVIQTVIPGRKYRISPALWEEPRCYWRTSGVDQVVTLRELPNQSTQDWEWEFVPVPGTNFHRIKGSHSLLYVDEGKVKSTDKTRPSNVFAINTRGAYFTIAPQNTSSLVECENGKLGNSTDIQVHDYTLSSSTFDSWTDFSKMPPYAARSLWKLDRADILPTSWMDKIADKTQKLNELAICGTHDTCTWKWSSANYSRTQDLTVLQQLKIGIRYLDIRLGPDFETYHGGKNCVSFEDVLKAISDFLAESGSGNETIIMAIAGGDGLASFATDLRDLLDGRTADGKITASTATKLKPKWYYENRVPALSEVQGKVVLVRRYADTQPNPPGIDLSMWGPVHDNDSFTATGIGGVVSVKVQDEYWLTLNSTKKGYIETLLPDMATPARTADNWYINFTSAGKGEQPSSYSNDINPWLGAVLNFHTSMRGTFVMDYPSAAIVDRIVQFNF